MHRILLWLVTLALTGCALGPAGTPTERCPRIAKSPTFRIATYNVLAGTKAPRETVAAIRRLQAEIVVLQEIAPRGAILLDRELRHIYPHRFFSNGLAVVSKFSLDDARFERSQRGINGFLLVEVLHPRGRFQVANLHLDPLQLWSNRDRLALPAQLLWGQGRIHRSELAQVQKLLRPGVPTIVLGDFNRVSAAAPARLRQLGFTDSFAIATPSPNRTPTLHFSLFGHRMGRRIDYIFHDSSFETVASHTLPGYPSDHDAVISTLQRKGRVRAPALGRRKL